MRGGGILVGESFSAAVGVQHRAQRTDRVAVRSVVDVHAPPFGLDQSGPPELAQVVADGGLGQSQRRREVAAVLLPG